MKVSCSHEGRGTGEAARWSAGQRGTMLAKEGARVLPYMGDFLVLVSSRVEALRPAWKRAAFCGTLPVSASGGASGKIISQEIHFVISTKRVSGAKVKLTRQAWARGVVAQATGSEPVERTEDLAEPHEGQVAQILRWGERDWHQHMVDRVSSALSAQFPRYSAQCGTVGKTSAVSLTHIAFDDGDEEHLNMDIKEYEAVGPEALQHVSRWGERAYGEDVASAGEAARHVSAIRAHELGLHPVGRADSELLRVCTYVVFAFVTSPATTLAKVLRAVGTLLEKCCFLGGWSQLSSAIHPYIDPTAVTDEHMERYFGWSTPRWREQQPGTVPGAVPSNLCEMAM
eukprot:gene2521-biopygen2451